MLGIVTQIFHNKGYGFIIDEMWNNCYFHFTSLKCESENVTRRTVVSFESETNKDGGKIAVNIMQHDIKMCNILPSNYDEVLTLIDKHFSKHNGQIDADSINKDAISRKSIHDMTMAPKKTFAITNTQEISIHKLITINLFKLEFDVLIDFGKSIEEMTKVVDALFFHLPVGEIILYQKDTAHFMVLSGHKVIVALYEFMNNQFALKGCKLRRSLENTYFTNDLNPLNPKLKDYFTNIKIKVTTISGELVDENIDLIKNYYI